MTLARAEKLQRALFKTEEEQAIAAIAQLSSPVAEEKRDEEEKDRLPTEDKGFSSCRFLTSKFLLFF